jgi:hypothetical protein
MKKFSSLALLVGVGLLGVTVPCAKADEWNKKTAFTFSGPVELPGMVLPAGTYVFKLMDSLSDRNIVQVFNKDETHVYGTFLAIPDYRLKTPGKTIITFEERSADSPEAVKAWFYPGDNYGNEFVYPKARAAQLAKQSNQPVPSMPPEMASNVNKPAESPTAPSVMAMKKAPIKVQKPAGEETQVAEAFPPHPAQMAAAKPPSRLPKTASALPLIGLIGFLSLAGALSLQALAKRIA